MIMTATIPTLLILLCFALVGASEHDTTRQLFRRRLGRDKGDEKDDSDDQPAPSLRPSTPPSPPPTKSPNVLATTSQPSPGPISYLLVTPNPAPGSSTTATVLPPALFHDHQQQTATTASSPSAESPTSTTMSSSFDEKKLMLLVLNSWVDPSVLQVALRLFDASQQAEIVATRSVSDGVAYELSVVDWSWVVDCTTASNAGGALDAYLRESFPAGYSSVAVSVVRIERLSASSGGISDQDDQEEAEDQQMMILILCLSAAVLCCCSGIAFIIVPAYCKYRRELVAEWSYDQDKERTLRGVETMKEEEESGTRSSQ